MKLRTKIISFILVLLLIFSAAIPGMGTETIDGKDIDAALDSELFENTDEEEPAAEPVTGETDTDESDEETDNISLDELFDGTIPAITTSQFVKLGKIIRTLISFANGRFITGTDNNLKVDMDEQMKEICSYLAENSCLDIYELFTNLPDINSTQRLINAVFKLDTTAYRDKMYELAAEFETNGDDTKEKICHFIGAYFSGIENAYLYLEEMPKGDPRVCLDVTYSDGTVETFHPGIFINPETGECYGKNDSGMMELGFNSNVYETLVYAPINCWMRSFGFCIEYDFLCYLLPVYRYNTRRFKFDYEGKEWMVQIWKGNYLITNGGEAGIYNRSADKFGSFYNTIGDDEMMPMSLTIYHGDDVLVRCDEKPHWWVNGFKLAHNALYRPDSLTLNFTVTVYDEEMLTALCNAIDSNLHHDVTYEVNGLTLNVTW